MKRYFKLLISLIILFELLTLGCSNSRSVPTGNSSVSLLTGEWVVEAQTVSPLIITPLCKPVRKGTTFKFTPHTLEVYIDASVKPCDVYIFKVTANTISFIKEDMVWLCTYELKTNVLKIKSDNFFSPDASNVDVSGNKQPLTSHGVVVTLTKKKLKP